MSVSMEVCRTCMTANQKKRPGKLVSIFAEFEGAVIANIITDCTAVQIAENDGLPVVICYECFETLKLLTAFKITARNSDSKLRMICKEESVESYDKAYISAQVEVLYGESQQQAPDEIAEELFVEPKEEDQTDNDTDSDWKESDQDTNRTVKRQKLGLRSKPKPRKRIVKTVVSNRSIQKESDFLLSEKERELFTVVKIPHESHICCGCLQFYSTDEELDAHRKSSHVWRNENMRKPSTKPICDGCLRRYDTPRGLNFHKERVRMLEIIWECKKCQFRFKAADKRRKHLRIHSEDAPVAMKARFKEETMQEFGWLCCASKCDESFNTEQDLIEHSQVTHLGDKKAADAEFPDNPEQCLICFRRYGDRRRLINHQRRKYKRKNFQCALCGLKFATTSELTTHEANDHGNWAFKCALCGKAFPQKYSLNSHLKTMHTDEKPHQCTVCGMTFRQKGGLRTHMSNHVEVPQFKCEVCSKMFKAKLHLRYHMRTHTGERPYKCRYCDHAFANNTNYRRHEMTHTGNKPHKCSYCGKGFILRRMLIEHEKNHTGDIRIEEKPVHSTKKKSEFIVELLDEQDNDDVDEVVECSSDDDTNGLQTFSLRNRPVSISLAKPKSDPQHLSNVAHQIVTKPIGNLVPATNNTIDVSKAPAVAVYNVVPATTSGNFSYVLKLQ